MVVNAVEKKTERKKKRPPPRLANVARVEHLTPRLTRITFQGEQLASFGTPKPAVHIKLLFLPEGSTWNPQDPKDETPRPPSRTYTPRRYDPQTCEIDVEFMHHGGGLASDWARTAQPGDPMFIGGPGGGYEIAEGIERIVMVADETSIPAAGMILEALPADCRRKIICEVEDLDDERDLSSLVKSSPNWLHRKNTDLNQGVLLERAVHEIAQEDLSSHWWIACEAMAMRRIKSHLLNDLKIDESLVHTRGYWKLGENNHPDHDFGND